MSTIVATAAELDAQGYADLGPVLDDAACQQMIAGYDDSDAFRRHVIMQRHGFGDGAYKYFADPLPTIVARLRDDLYRSLVDVANGWAETMGVDARYPSTHAEFRQRCQTAGQTRPTPLLLRYRRGDYNCLHQDLYGEQAFPLQVVILLSAADAFDGGELVITVQRPRLQSRVEVVPLRRGHAVAFAVNDRPQRGRRGIYRVRQRHGVSRVRAGERFALGIIFHDAA